MAYNVAQGKVHVMMGRSVLVNGSSAMGKGIVMTGVMKKHQDVQLQQQVSAIGHLVRPVSGTAMLSILGWGGSWGEGETV